MDNNNDLQQLLKQVLHAPVKITRAISDFNVIGRRLEVALSDREVTISGTSTHIIADGDPVGSHRTFVNQRGRVASCQFYYQPGGEIVEYIDVRMRSGETYRFTISVIKLTLVHEIAAA